MKEHLIQEVQRQMLPYLNNAQLKQLKAVLEKALTGVTVHRDKAADVSESVDTVSLFITAKRIEGCAGISRTTKRKENPARSRLITFAGFYPATSRGWRMKIIS